MSALRASQDLREALSAVNIRFVHWKSNSHLAEALAGETDLDLLIHRDDEAAFRQVMEQLRALAMTSPLWARYPSIEDWLILDEATGGLLHLHVHYHMLTGLRRVKHLRLPWTDEVLASVRADPSSGWPVPSAEMELLNLLVRIWAKMPLTRRLLDQKIPGHIQTELRWLQNQTDPVRLAALGNQLGLAGDFQDAFGSDMAAIRLGRRLNTELARHFRMSWPEALMRAALLNARLGLTRLWLKFVGPVQIRKTLPTGGAMVALVGSDGSGKSTLGRDLEKWLRYKLDAHLLYMGSGDGASGWINTGKRRVSALWKRRKPQTVKSIRPASAIEKLYRVFDLLLLRRKLRLLRLGRTLAGRGSIILTDRYPQMQVNGISDGPRQQEGRGFDWAARAELKLHRAAATLGPDLVIKLKIDPATAQLRKPDHDFDTIARKCAIVDALTFGESKIISIDAARPYEDVLLAAKSAIWNHLLRGSRSMIVECVGLPGAGKTTICGHVSVRHGKKGAVPISALRIDKSLVRAAWHIARLALSARPISFHRLKRAFNLVVFLRHYQARDQTILLDQGVVQKLWSLLFDASYSTAKLDCVLRSLRPFTPDHLVFITTPVTRSAQRIAERRHGNSRFDGLSQVDTERRLAASVELLDLLVAKTGAKVLHLDGTETPEANAARIDRLLGRTA